MFSIKLTLNCHHSFGTDTRMVAVEADDIGTDAGQKKIKTAIKTLARQMRRACGEPPAIIDGSIASLKTGQNIHNFAA